MIEDEEIFAIVKGARDIVEAGQNLIDRANEKAMTISVLFLQNRFLMR